MFDRVRLRLMLVYILATLVLIGGIGAGVYGLMAAYFGSTTDLALRYRAAVEVRLRGGDLPPDLLAAEREYAASGSIPIRPTVRTEDDEEHEREEHGDGVVTRYQPDQAPIFVLPMLSDGRLVVAAGVIAAPVEPDREAVRMALARGLDSRTVMSGGERIRLLTYRIDGVEGLEVLQVGRVLSDQDAVLRGLFSGLLLLSAVAAILVGLVSWWMAGRSLQPARQAWERQQAFIANASHELRTPVTLIRASAEVALRGLDPTDTDRGELLRDVLSECDHMGRLVDDLLLLSRLDAGQLTLESCRVDLAELVGGAARQVGRVALERGVNVLVERADGAALADPTRLRQVLLILLDNAVRHTPPGGSVTVSTARTPIDGHQPALGGRRASLVEISVADTGSGIAPEHLPRLFERFYRVDSARGGEGGAGLGLAIARALVEAQGGRISMESVLGRGTRVTVRVPGA